MHIYAIFINSRPFPSGPVENQIKTHGRSPNLITPLSPSSIYAANLTRLSLLLPVSLFFLFFFQLEHASSQLHNYLNLLVVVPLYVYAWVGGAATEAMTCSARLLPPGGPECDEVGVVGEGLE